MPTTRFGVGESPISEGYRGRFFDGDLDGDLYGDLDGDLDGDLAGILFGRSTEGGKGYVCLTWTPLGHHSIGVNSGAVTMRTHITILVTGIGKYPPISPEILRKSESANLGASISFL